jgi:excisionase family DNA binding protein
MFDEKKPPTSERNPVGSNPPMIERLLDSTEAASLLGIHPRTLQRMVLRGEIKGIHIGKLWRFKASALGAWIERKMAS